MASLSYKVVLSDKLYSIYKKASVSNSLKTKERKAYEALIGNVELEILTNLAQIERCKATYNLPDEIYNDLLPALLTVDDQKSLSLDELSKKTLFKLIVTQSDDEVNPPYFNVKKKHIQRNYNITRLHNEDRQSLKEYIVGLLQDADEILIHDKYFSKNEENKELFRLLPDKNILIQYVENGDGDNGQFIIDGCCRNDKWTVRQCDTTQPKFNRFARSHDRYLIINDIVEVTLTSGFSYIWRQEKEITCIIREMQM